ncbi:phosphonate ABC transporter, permease protein PhnE [Sporomusa sp. KB1]|jgi:phosphonate transport system permease protein|uniref:phosphonate ABC transporter, permease protein PhnE n=1 Tax=Sporomusa sp. KB1 TaxID=943346 RepID=UPI0011AB9647|nr:phosphonate ABC transporter, permease protein PhnE [Sporomusa sp. KB1]TWH47234.1 phosphonate transport system permease protein [Sporomusa sp. KB1]
MPNTKTHWGSYLTTLILLTGIVISGFDTKFSPTAFFEPSNLKAMTRFAGGLWPPEMAAEFLGNIGKLLLETVEISLVATALAIVLALPMSVAAMRPSGEEFSRSVLGWPVWSLRWAVYYLSRSILALFRGIPELMWALLFVVAVGLGPFPGVLALTAHSVGILGKLYAEIFEAVDQRLVEMARVTGASELQVLAFVRFPVTLPVFLSYTLFRWECNMRSATVLGFVGAGGIGTQLMISMKLFMYQEVATLVLAIFALVIAVELAGQYLRTYILRPQAGTGQILEE